MAVITKTKPAGVMDDLAAVDDAQQRIADLIGELRAEQSQLGGRPPMSRTSTIAGLKEDIKQARATALRRGVEPDLAKLQERLAAAHARADEVAEELGAAQVAEVAVGHERLALLRDRHSEFLALAEAEVKRGESLLAALAVAALDVGDQRVIAQAALRLAFDGDPGNYPNKTTEQEAERKAAWRSFEPWAHTNSPQSNALWQSITTITTPRAGV
jgi:hypothetical protein